MPIEPPLLREPTKPRGEATDAEISTVVRFHGGEHPRPKEKPSAFTLLKRQVERADAGLDEKGRLRLSDALTAEGNLWARLGSCFTRDHTGNRMRRYDLYYERKSDWTLLADKLQSALTAMGVHEQPNVAARLKRDPAPE